MTSNLRSEYAWIIDSGIDTKRKIPRIGPWNADYDLIDLLERGDFGRNFRIFSEGRPVCKGRILGQFKGNEPIVDMNFVEDLDTIEYKNSNGFWEEL